jgi:hypothetical protein
MLLFVVLINEMSYLPQLVLSSMLHPFKDEAQAALFKDPVRTNQFIMKVAQVAVCSEIKKTHKYSVGTAYSC